MRAALMATALLALSAMASTAASTDEAFELHEVTTGAARHQSILPGRFTGDATAEFVVVRVGVQGGRDVQHYRLDSEGWSESPPLPLGADVRFVDVAMIGGHDTLLVYTSGSLNRFDLETGEQTLLAAVDLDFYAPPESAPRLDLTRDLNGDGRDDILVPSVDGFLVSLQRRGGTFTKPVRLGPREPFQDQVAHDDDRPYRETGIGEQNLGWYQDRVHQIDYDLDGRVDLAFWDGERFEWHRQQADGAFELAAGTFSSDVAFDLDGAYGLVFETQGASSAALLLGFRKRIERVALQGFPDLNGDDVADLVTLTVSGRSILRLRGRYAVHFGRAVPGGTEWPSEPDTTVAAPGTSGGMQAFGYATREFLDFDGDGVDDLVMSAVHTGPVGMVRAMLGNAIAVDLVLHRLHAGVYRKQPDAARTVRSRLAPLDHRGPHFPTVLLGDVTGDARMDLLTGTRWNELNVYRGIGAPNILASEPVRVAVAVPSNERNAMLADLDGDGRQDVVIHHPAKEAESSHRVLVLLSRLGLAAR